LAQGDHKEFEVVGLPLAQSPRDRLVCPADRSPSFTLGLQAEVRLEHRDVEHVVTTRRPLRKNGDMPLDRIAWIAPVVVCVVTCVLLLFSGYLGYAGVLLAIAGSAAINLG
jgi:hypothetical protein